MNVILLVTFVALSLLCGAQGEAQCIKETGANSFCGCELKDSSNNTVVNITLDFIGKKTVHHDLLYQFTYSPCSGDSDCDDGKAAVCRHMEGDPFSHKSIGSLNSVAYKVNNPTHVNVSAIYLGPEGDTAVVYLMCDKTNDGTLKFVHHDRKNNIYYFQLDYSRFCMPPKPSTTSKSMATTSTSTANAVTTMTVHTTVTTTGTNTPTVTTSVPSITTGMMTTTTNTVAPTSTSSPSKEDNQDDKWTVLIVVLSIVGAMVVGVTVALIIAYVRKKKQAQYETLPTL